MAQQLAGDQLRTVLSQTLAPDATIRRNAERHLTEARKVPGHSMEVLRLVASGDASNAPVRQAAAIHFKNIVKHGWDEQSDNGTSGIQISPSDRTLIKRHLVELMCTVPPQIQAQCSESISLIAAVDFPKQWDNLLPELVAKFQSPDANVVDGVLKTANSIFKRFRYVEKSDALYSDIIYSLKHIQEPLLILLQQTGSAIDALVNDAAQLTPRFSILRSICRIFYSLNYQDLPEFFEDHMKQWMDEFAKYLQYQNPVLEDADEEEEASPIDTLQAAIIANLNLYADKDEEPFLPFLPQFTTLVWNLLLRVTQFRKHDALATTSIRFLSSLVRKLMHKALFQEESTLRQIISKIVIPNLMLREVDEERFEDDPHEFMLTDIEGSESESRRKCSQELLRAMCRQFETETTALCSEHVGTMLTEFATNPNEKWQAKDAAIHLMFGIAILAESAGQGVSQVNDAVNVMDFFTTHIFPELQDANHTVRPMLKATALKFVSTFRNQFTREQLTALMPLMISHLASPSVVVHTYAAFGIEKILTTKDLSTKRIKFGGSDLKSFLEPLFTSLFGIVDNVELNENEYVMKCIMRSCSVADADIIPVTQIVLEKLTAALGRVAKNPRNPQYNHFMFESIAVLVKSVCSKDPNLTASFEGLLFPPFQTVLQMDVFEFIPYVFQVLAQLLEYRPADSGLGEAYTMLFAPLLTPTLWERKGNIPALTRLICAYLGKAAAELSASLLGILGVFQKLVSSKANEVSAFELLQSLVQHVPQELLAPHLQSLFQILMMRLQHGKSARYVRLLTHFFAVFIGKFGGQAYMDKLNAIQPGMGLMLLVQIWLPRLQSDLPAVKVEAKAQVIGLTKLLCDTPALLSEPDGQRVWSQTLAMVVAMLTSQGSVLAGGGLGGGKTEAEDDEPMEVLEIGYDATFSHLHFAKRPVQDPFGTIQDPAMDFVKAIHALSQSQGPGRLQPIIQQGLSTDPKLSAGFENMFQKAGLNL